MKRIYSVALVMLILFAGAFSASAKDTYTFKITHEEYANTVSDLYAKELARRVTEKSNGRIKFEVFQVGQLGVGVDLVEHLLTGSTQIAIVSPNNVATIVPEGQMFTLHWLLPSNVEKTYEFLAQSNVVKNDLAAAYAEKNLRLMDLWPLGAVCWLSNTKLTSPADFKGQPFRTMAAPQIVKNYQAYGANPTPVPYTDVYSALQLKMVNGSENPMNAFVDMKWYEVQKYFVLSEHTMYLDGVFMNDRFFKSLPKDLQNILTETIAEMHEKAYELQKKGNADAFDVLSKHTEVVTLSDDQRDAFRRAALPARDHYKKTMSKRSVSMLEKLEKELASFK